METLTNSFLDCTDCYDEGVLFFGNGGEDFDSEFCVCDKGVSLENEYCQWYAESVMNENYKENN
jgi:hypothetical protein